MPKSTDGITLREIQRIEASDSKKYFPGHRDSIEYLAIALGGESGEVLNNVKKWMRGSMTQETLVHELSHELPDILIYLVMLADFVGIDLTVAWEDKKEFNDERFAPSA